MLSIRNLSHAYGNTPVLRDVSLDVSAGKLTCLVGASGCGKSTLLRLIAGLETVQSGDIAYNNTTLASETQHIPASQRNIGLVFQHPALFPHLNVERNIRFGLRHLPKDQQHTITQTMLELIGLSNYAKRYPHQLSGGQHQRVALARSLAPSPTMMLLDEPFANLDHAMRRNIREDILHTLAQANIPIIMVTHDPEEALMMADTMVLLGQHGRIHQTGSPDALHNQPADIEAAKFFGHINVLEGHHKGGMIATPLGELPVSALHHVPNAQALHIVTRPEGIRTTRANETGAPLCVSAVAHTGAGWLVSGHLPEGQLMRLHHIYGTRPAIGDIMHITFEPPHIFAFTQS